MVVPRMLMPCVPCIFGASAFGAGLSILKEGGEAYSGGLFSYSTRIYPFPCILGMLTARFIEIPYRNTSPMTLAHRSLHISRVKLREVSLAFLHR